MHYRNRRCYDVGMAGLRRSIVALVAVASCRGTPSSSGPASESTKSAPTSSPCGAMSCVDLGRAHELGTGRPRDYRAAAAAYRRGCDAGEAKACRLLGYEIASRRSDEELEIGVAASRRACTLGDIVACWQLSRSQYVDEALDATSEAQKQTAEAAFAARRAQQLPLLRDACQRGDVAACELVPCEECECHEPTCEEAKKKRERALCLVGSGLSCSSVLMDACSLDRTCLAELPRSADADMRALVEHVTRGCDAGDPDMCLGLGRPISYAELCAAHDHLSCKLAEEERAKAMR